MFIFVDESGTFTNATTKDSWCVVAAYVCPEASRRAVDRLIEKLRLDCNEGRETKLKHICDDRYSAFLKELAKLGGIVFAVAVDISLHTTEEVLLHRDRQAEGVLYSLDKMLHDSAKKGLQALADEIRALPAQLYTQLMCQVQLFHKVLTRAPLYFVQRNPIALGHFRWRIDCKDTVPTRYENAFRLALPGLLQSISLRDPMPMLEGTNYKYFNRFSFPIGQEPTFLRSDYGIDHGEVSDVGKMVREDFKFVNSTSMAGVQVADLLAAGVRRLLMGGFSDPESIAQLIGSNMVQAKKGESSVSLISLDQIGEASEHVTKMVRLINRSSRPMLTG